jgi:hypothetical protein
VNGAHLLALANPLAALRKRDAFQLARQFRRKIVHANSHQTGALAQCPSVAGMITEILWDFEAAGQSGLQSRSGLVLGSSELESGLHNGLAAAEMIDQQETCECEENQ